LNVSIASADSSTLADEIIKLNKAREDVNTFITFSLHVQSMATVHALMKSPKFID